MTPHMPRSKVQLHIHLDGAVRPSTIFDVARRRGMNLGVSSAEDLAPLLKVSMDEAVDLQKFLAPFSIINPVIAGDEDAIRRMAYEYCEDSARQGVVYSEVRYCPHLFANSYPDPMFGPPGFLTPHRVVTLVLKGLEEGSQKFGTKARSVLCCLRPKPEWSREILDLCVEFRESGVVGIDIAGEEPLTETELAESEHVHIFREAAKLGINRTVHAGENGSCNQVSEAVDLLLCQRVGHGYRVIDNEDIYKRLLKSRMHFEVCPYSGILTGSVNKDLHDHLLKRLVADGGNFSLSSDDPTVTGSTMDSEYSLCMEKMGLTIEDIYQANLNAAEASFLPEDERRELVEKLKKEYNMAVD